MGPPPPLKIKISRIGPRHVLSWPKVGLEPKFHESGTFSGFGKREQTHTHINTRFMFYKYRLVNFIFQLLNTVTSILSVDEQADRHCLL